jgi:hypothetical protein
MPILSCYVDDRTLAILQRESAVSGRTVEQLAEAAIESEAIASLPGGYLGGGQHFLPLRDDPMLGRESTLRPGFFEGDMP